MRFTRPPFAKIIERAVRQIPQNKKMNNTMAVQLAIMLFCIIMSAYFSATETAFSTFNRAKLKPLAERGNKKASKVLKLAENYDKLISTILIGNNIVNIALASLGTLVFVNLIGDAGATVSTVVITVLVLIFGEISPKSIAKDCPEKFAMFAAPLIGFLVKVFTPLNFIFSQWKKLLARMFRIQSDSKMSQEELLTIVEEASQDGGIDSGEGDLLRNAIEFTELRAEDILTHRVDLEGVSVEATKEEIAAAFTETKYSRLLVYKENMDSIVGVIHQKDLYSGTGLTKKPLKDIIAPAIHIHQFEKISDILKTLQREKSHVAVVVDEYGGTLGIVTMEDILEELVGDIWDEHDEVEEDFRQLSENTYRVDCNVTMDDFCAFFDIRAEYESVSLSGWIMEQLERVPEKGDRLQIENLDITVNEIGSHRAESVIVKVNGKKTDDDE